MPLAWRSYKRYVRLAIAHVFGDVGVQGGALAHDAADVIVLLDEALRCNGMQC